MSIDKSHGYVLGNSTVVKIYIIRPKLGPVAKNATPRSSVWEYIYIYIYIITSDFHNQEKSRIIDVHVIVLTYGYFFFGFSIKFFTQNKDDEWFEI